MIIIKKNTILNRVFSCFGAVVIAVLAILLPVKLGSNFSNVAYADSVDVQYSFHASDFYSFSCYHRTSGGSTGFYSSLFSCDFSQNVDGSILFDPTFYDCSASGMSFTAHLDNYFNVFKFGGTNHYGDSNYCFYDNFSLNSSGTYAFLPAPDLTALVSSKNWFEGSIYYQSGFNCNVYKVTLGLVTTGYRYSGSEYKYLHIDYYDENENLLSFEFYVPSNFIFNTRTYYFNSSSDFTDSQQYNIGYQDGLNANQQNIYNDGYSAGNTYGYSVGYQAGTEASNQYTFLNLVGSVIDAPVQAFMGLFNFNLLGVNMANFFLSLLTVAVIVTIIKIVL